MIKIRTRIHDKFSLEFKLWLLQTIFKDAKPFEKNSFILESWTFIPGSLDINAATYTRGNFYADLKSYYRTITPVYKLGSMHENVEGQPLFYLAKSISSLSETAPNFKEADILEFEYQVKMFSAIFKSALREDYSVYKSSRQSPVALLRSQTLNGFIADMLNVTDAYIKLGSGLEEKFSTRLVNTYLFGLEFCINLVQFYLYKILDANPDENSVEQAKESLQKVAEIKRRFGLGQITKKNRDKNTKLLYKWAVLKKFVESDLFLVTDTKKDGMLTEQFYSSIAAGLSMIFATVISFTFQQKYGNFTLPFFIALVIGYMFKDRIKELCRYSFAKNRKINYYDNKTKLAVKDENIGVAREGVDFVPHSKIPVEILAERGNNVLVDVDEQLLQESVLFYRTRVDYNPLKLSGNKYKIQGLNQILVVNLMGFIKKMDDPKTVLRSPLLEKVDVDRVYYVTIILRLTSRADDETTYKHYRIALNRDGIKGIEEL